MTKTLIIGGVAGGATAAARLRRLDEKAQIVMLERGEYISFANCGLPYYIGDKISDRDELILQTPESLNARFAIDVRDLSQALSIDCANKTVQVKDLRSGKIYDESYDKLLLSPGAAPLVPPLPGLDDGRVFTLRNIADTFSIKDYILQRKPQKAVVVGGGYIGLEMAENLQAAGLSVTVVEATDHVITALDYDMACEVHNHLREKGVRLLLKQSLQACRPTDDGLVLQLTDEEITADMLLLSIGVRPESQLAQTAGLAVDKKGAVVVDVHMRTSDPHIYAVGDVVQAVNLVSEQPDYIPLAGPANKQARIAANNIFGLNSIYVGTQGSAILKCFDLTVAMTGISEDKARKQGIDYEKSFTYSFSHATYYPDAEGMSIKIIFDKNDGQLLGAQIVGFTGVDKRIDVLATAIRAGMSVYDLTELELAYAPPYSSAKDPVNMAGCVAENILAGRVKIIHWHDIAALPRDGSVTLLDVRTEEEFADGSIDGFINIPIDELRPNLQRLDNAKPIYVLCHSALRSYIACQILEEHDFDCYNISGGWRLYSSIFAN